MPEVNVSDIKSETVQSEMHALRVIQKGRNRHERSNKKRCLVFCHEI